MEVSLLDKIEHKLYFPFYKWTASRRSNPNFLIIGTQKGGTTSLYDYLVQHPDINSAHKKEVHFFDQNYHRGLDWYKAFFPLKSKVGLTGEASPLYLYHPLVPSRVVKHFPKIKIIILLRNPVQRAFSHYKMEYREKREILNFKNAIEKEESRLGKERELVAQGIIGPNHQNHSYLDRGLYVTQIKRWLKYFERDQILFLQSENFFDNPEHTYNTVLRFLNLSKNKQINFSILNQDSSKAKMDLNLERKLQNYFAPFNQELYQLLGVRFNWGE